MDDFPPHDAGDQTGQPRSEPRARPGVAASRAGAGAAPTPSEPGARAGFASIDEDDDGVSTGEKLLKWAARASVVGAAISLLLHLVIGLIAGLLTVRYPDADAGGSPPGQEVDFAVMTESELRSLMSPDESETEPLVPERTPTTDPAALELTQTTPLTSESLVDTTLDVEIAPGAGDVSDAGGGGISGGAGGGGASFFGLEAQGSRFAYIVDRSSSMRGAKMSRTRSELSRSITALPDNGEFFVVFYSDEPEVLGARRSWRTADERSKAAARREISSVEPNGGTQPLPAFRLVFGDRIKPDAIYFMTDGQFSDEVPDAVAAMNARFDIPVHCILFGEPSSNRSVVDVVRDNLRRISTASGGQFRHVEITP